MSMNKRETKWVYIYWDGLYFIVEDMKKRYNEKAWIMQLISDLIFKYDMYCHII